jgi:hypothetical protein
MSTKTTLKILFSCIFLTLLIYTGWAGRQQTILQWRGNMAMSGYVLLQLVRLRPDQSVATVLSARNR